MDPGNEYSVPYLVGASGTYTQEDSSGKKIDPWNALWDPDLRIT